MREVDPATGYLVNQWPTLSAAVPDAKLRVLSLGVGVQSSTMALMAARGDVGPMPDVAIFADPQWESPATYAYLEYLAELLPFTVARVTSGNIREDIIGSRNSTGQRFASVPWYIRVDGQNSEGMGRRQCTKEYKLVPIKREVRRLLGVAPGRRVGRATIVEQWIGISTDEIVRMKPSKDRWIQHRWPLIEAGMSRRDCETWLMERQYRVPPKSACIGCPFHTNAMWREMRDQRPEEWADACAVDRALREGGHYKMRGTEYMHRSLLPLEDADLADDDPRQLGFDLECEGMCGV